MLQGQIGDTFTGTPNYGLCEDHPEALCAEWKSSGKSSVKEYIDGDATCYDIHTVSTSKHGKPTDCFDISNTYWYGGAETYRDRWPVMMQIPERPHLAETGSYGSVLERYWFSNRGVGIFVNESVPLYVRGNTREFCLIANYDGVHYRNWDDQLPFLKYTICVHGNVKDVHVHMLRRFISKPKGIPDEKMMKYPVWSTWAKFKSYITQMLTIQYTDEIVKHGFPACQIELDDIYTINYGDYVFDPKKFPDPNAMITHIHSKGFRLNVWTHPFSNEHTQSYVEGRDRGYWVMDEFGKTGRAGWWRGFGGVLDVTNPDAVKWYFSRLQKIRDLGVDGHKYDAGEIGFLPKKFTTKKLLKNPMEYTSIYAEAMYNYTNTFMQVRVGYKTQHLPIFVSMMDRNSDWGYNMGLKSLIATSLVFASMGYYFVMPDMIGGNAYCSQSMDCTNYKPDRELFIRWLQLNTFLPMMQFSFTPWQYDDEVVVIAKKYVALHADYVAPKMISLGKSAMLTGYPLVRPMWWAAPDDPHTHTIDTQFMIGDDLVVAPIVEQGATSRDVYLPRGLWRDMLHGQEHSVEEDGFYLREVEAGINDCPYYERVLMP